MKKLFSFLLVISLYSWGAVSSAQDAAMIEAAKKEGKVIWYTSVSYTHLTLPTKRIV